MIRPLKALLLTTTLHRCHRHGGAGGAGADTRRQQPTKTLKAVPNFVTATDAMMRAPKPEDWIIHRGNYQSWGYSSLQQINKGNVKSLQLAWSRAMAPGINQATPLVYNGIMYLGNPGDVIQAIDAANGDLLWEYKHPLPPAADFPATHGQRKRSIALFGNRVFTVTWNNYVVALDARTGEQVWQTDRGGGLYVSNSTGPIVANGVVVAGSTCQVAGFPCYVTGHDAETGQRAVEQRARSSPRPTGRRDVGRRALRKALDDRRVGTAHL